MGTRKRDRQVYRPLWGAGLEVIPNAVPDGTMPFVHGYGAEDVVGGFSHRYERRLPRPGDATERLTCPLPLWPDGQRGISVPSLVTVRRTWEPSGEQLRPLE